MGKAKIIQFVALLQVKLFYSLRHKSANMNLPFTSKETNDLALQLIWQASRAFYLQRVCQKHDIASKWQKKKDEWFGQSDYHILLGTSEKMSPSISYLMRLVNANRRKFKIFSIPTTMVVEVIKSCWCLVMIFGNRLIYWMFLFCYEYYIFYTPHTSVFIFLSLNQ